MSMRGAGMNAHMAMRSLTRDSSVKDSKLKKGTLPRIWEFARPFKFYLLCFLITIVLDALLTVSTPLILRNLIDQGVIPKKYHVVTVLSILVGVLAVTDSVTNLVGRWFSARIGEGLIYEMRTKVFSHRSWWVC